MTIFPQAEPGSDPLQCVTNLDVNIPPEKVADMTGFLVDILNPSIMELRRLFLLESIFDTIKFILCLWGLTYIGSWYEITYFFFPISSYQHSNVICSRFNMMTLVILTWVGFFTVPLVYKNNQVQYSTEYSTVQYSIRTTRWHTNNKQQPSVGWQTPAKYSVCKVVWQQSTVNTISSILI